MKALLAALSLLLAPIAPAMAQGFPLDQTIAVACSAAPCVTGVIPTQGAGTVSIQATGGATGLTFSFQGTNDGSTWQTLPGAVPATGAVVTTASGDGIWTVAAPGFQRVRVNMTAIGSGTETFSLESAVGSLGAANVSSFLSSTITNPTSVLTRPANTTNYAQNNLVASSTTAGSVVVPSFAIANSAGGVAIPRVRLTTNKTTGWDTVTLRVRLWSAAPTFTNGDGGAYVVATGAATLLGQYDVTLTQFADGASGNAAPSVGTAAWIRLASGTSVFWDCQYTGSAALTPASGQTFTLIAELAN